MKQTEQYIFCPVCGSYNWVVDKSQDSIHGSLTGNKCGSCGKFNFIELSVTEISPIGLKIFYKTLYREEVTIDKYDIRIYHVDNQTTIWDDEKGEMILSLNHAVKFDWYREKNIIDKIKKMLVFS